MLVYKKTKEIEYPRNPMKNEMANSVKFASMNFSYHNYQYTAAKIEYIFWTSRLAH